MDPRLEGNSRQGCILLGVGITVLLCAIVTCASLAGYNRFFYVTNVEPGKVGVQLEGDAVKAVVGPGTYADAGLAVHVEQISCTPIPMTVTDPEAITKDRQRVAVTVSASIHRTCDEKFVAQTWSQYQALYLDDEAAQARVTDLVLQALKTCVGDRDAEAVVEDTDALGACVEEGVNQLGGIYGLGVEGVTIREVSSVAGTRGK